MIKKMTIFAPYHFTKVIMHNFSAGPCILPQEVFREAASLFLISMTLIYR